MHKNAPRQTLQPVADAAEKAPPDPRQIVLKGFEELMAGPVRKGNRIRQLRLERMMSRSELARKAGLSPITIARIEAGLKARLETKRKLLEALGLSLDDRAAVFFDEAPG